MGFQMRPSGGALGFRRARCGGLRIFEGRRRGRHVEQFEAVAGGTGDFESETCEEGVSDQCVEGRGDQGGGHPLWVTNLMHVIPGDLGPDMVAALSAWRSEEQTSALQSLMRNSYTVF